MHFISVIDMNGVLVVFSYAMVVLVLCWGVVLDCFSLSWLSLASVETWSLGL